MFASLKAEFANRSVQVAQFWRLVDELEKREIAENVTKPGLRSLKGLMFVQFYAAYEYVVLESFAAVVKQFNAHAFSHKELKRELLAIGFQTRFQSICDISDRKAWQPKIDLLKLADAADVVRIAETTFPQDDSHFRVQQLKTICSVLAMPKSALVPDPRLIGWISEVVENRNAIAHGRETAEAIGSRYSSGDLDTRRAQLDHLCNHIIGTLEAHSTSAANFRR